MLGLVEGVIGRASSGFGSLGRGTGIEGGRWVVGFETRGRREGSVGLLMDKRIRILRVARLAVCRSDAGILCSEYGAIACRF